MEEGRTRCREVKDPSISVNIAAESGADLKAQGSSEVWTVLVYFSIHVQRRKAISYPFDLFTCPFQICSSRFARVFSSVAARSPEHQETPT